MFKVIKRLRIIEENTSRRLSLSHGSQKSYSSIRTNMHFVTLVKTVQKFQTSFKTDRQRYMILNGSMDDFNRNNRLLTNYTKFSTKRPKVLISIVKQHICERMMLFSI